SRGEERIFIWCIFLAICELVIDGAEAYNWVKYIYIDDPISSLDENNTIAIACDLAQLLLRNDSRKVRSVISSHHSLFYNVICNEFNKTSNKKFYFHHNKNTGTYTLQSTNDIPFFHHVALLSELKRVVISNEIKTYHFNILRNILEKTSSFFNFNDIKKCIHGIEDEVLFNRAVNLFSHGGYSMFNPVEMNDDNKDLFNRILNGFLEQYKFELPELN
ncbi:MAG: AAA family ATPase, partial [Leptospiraceae bacterium]|nr:AAA family ATPase [Leptospiraceae bacterium]